MIPLLFKNNIFKDHSISTCLGAALNSCNDFLEEECTYDLSEENVEIPSGPVSDFNKCQQECNDVATVCKYWAYKNNTCYMLKSGERSCKVISGPKFPRITTCPCKQFFRPIDFVYVIGNLLLRFATYLINNFFRKKILL